MPDRKDGEEDFDYIERVVNEMSAKLSVKVNCTQEEPRMVANAKGKKRTILEKDEFVVGAVGFQNDNPRKVANFKKRKKRGRYNDEPMQYYSGVSVSDSPERTHLCEEVQETSEKMKDGMKPIERLKSDHDEKKKH